MARRFRRRPSLWLWLTLCLAAALVWRGWPSSQPLARTQLPANVTISAVVDGRTLRTTPIESSGPSVDVRLLGIEIVDETAARDYLAASVVGQSVRIELDKRRLDTDGAQFAYVYLGPTFLNAELIRQGWAKPETYPGDSASHARKMREASGDPIHR